MRFTQRKSVLFPQPEGPMRAVTRWAGAVRSTSATTWCLPNQALSFSIDKPSVDFSGVAVVSSTFVVAGAGSVATSGIRRTYSTAEEASSEGEDQHDGDECERSRPCAGLSFLKPCDRIVEDLQGECRHALRRVVLDEEVIAKGG